MSKICIWCLRESHDRDIEHIFPEALGCPSYLTLPGTAVCRKCNNDLAHLDQVIADDFDFLAVMHGIKRKRGRPAEIASRGNVYATSTTEGPNIFFNLDPNPFTAPTGHTVGPFRGRQRDVRPQIVHDGSGRVNVSFDIAFGQHRKFARGLYKIALSSVAYLQGPETALNPRFNWLRTYVRHGGRPRRILLTSASDSQFVLAAYPPWQNAEGDQAMGVRIAMAEFLLDLTASETQLSSFIDLARIHFGEEHFSVLPSDAYPSS